MPVIVTSPRNTAMPLRLVVAMAAAMLSPTATAGPPTAGSTALLREHCGACHLDGAREGGVSLDGVGTPDGPERATLVAAWRNLRAGTMPPADEPQPDASQRRALLDWMEQDVFGIDPLRPDPGPPVVRRLNRVEYANTVADLVGLDLDLLDDLPPDDTGYGFDTVGAVLALPPLLLERYLELAARVGEQVVAAARAPGSDLGDLTRVFPAGPPPADAAARPEHLRRTLAPLASRGFRRPADEATIDALAGIATAAGALDDSFPEGVAAAVTAILASPRFLLRVDAGPAAPAPGDPAVVPIDEHALAARLSYFLWSTMPDDHLLELAAADRLRRELPAQVARMIRDPRSDAIAANFVGQWLQTRDVEAVPVSLKRVLGEEDVKERQEAFDDRIRPAMRRETEMWFMHLLRTNAPATDILVGRTTFLNEELAAHYGIPGVRGSEMRLVSLPADSDRGGVLAQGSFLVVTSTPTRTSPVKRGLFVLDNLLGMPTPPAPPNVESLDTAAGEPGRRATMRELMERHRSDPACATCHARMDPIGLALEEYDAIGRRSQAEPPVDSAGRLATGEPFRGTRGLAAAIATSRRADFHRCLTEKMLTYALGRGLDVEDAPAVETIVARLEAGGGLASLVEGVVESVPFQMRRSSDRHRPPAVVATRVEDKR